MRHFEEANPIWLSTSCPYRLASSTGAGVSLQRWEGVWQLHRHCAQFIDLQPYSNIMSALLLFFSLLLAWTKGTRATDHTLPFMEYLDPDHVVCLKWGFDNLQGNITFQLAVNSTGWVSFGLSPNGGMKGSDIVMGGLGPSGSYFTVSWNHTADTRVAVDFGLATLNGNHYTELSVLWKFYPFVH